MATAGEHRTIAPVVGPDDPRRFTDSGIEIQPVYDEDDLPAPLDLGEPGAYPFTRGVHADMYRKQLWTMRQYAGYANWWWGITPSALRGMLAVAGLELLELSDGPFHRTAVCRPAGIAK